YSGVDFVCVEKDVGNRVLLPRNPDEPVEVLSVQDGKGERLNESSFKSGYLILDEGEEFWADDPVDIAPPEWLNSAENQFKPYYDWHMPKRIYFNSKGEYS